MKKLKRAKSKELRELYRLARLDSAAYYAAKANINYTNYYTVVEIKNGIKKKTGLLKWCRKLKKFA